MTRRAVFVLYRQGDGRHEAGGGAVVRDNGETRPGVDPRGGPTIAVEIESPLQADLSLRLPPTLTTDH
jgi:hypothetical protein